MGTVGNGRKGRRPKSADGSVAAMRKTIGELNAYMRTGIPVEADGRVRRELHAGLSIFEEHCIRAGAETANLSWVTRMADAGLPTRAIKLKVRRNVIGQPDKKIALAVHAPAKPRKEAKCTKTSEE